jgi:beta-lactamase class A
MENTTALAKIEELANSVEGTIGAVAWGLHDGGLPAIEFNADELFPTASTIKVPILFELYKQVEEGKVDLSQRIALTPEHLIPGSGVLQDLNFGINPTVRDLAVLMIVVSDNTATDILFDLLGRENVQATMLSLGLDQIHIPFKLRHMLYFLAGVDPADPTNNYAKVNQIFKGDFNPDPRALTDVVGENVLATPRNMARLCQMIALNQNLSAKSCEEMIDIMSRQKFRTRIPLHLPPTIKIANKTGSLKGVRADVGVVYLPGRPYTVALMSKNLSDPVKGEATLALISKVIYDYFTAPTE